MYCTKKMEEFFLKIGHPEKDLPQLKEALNICKVTVYNKKTKKEKRISKKRAIELVGLETFLGGISRAAFHWTSANEIDKENEIYFDCKKMFGY